MNKRQLKKKIKQSTFSIKKVKLNPNDVLVADIPSGVMEYAEIVKESIQKYFPNNEIMISSGVKYSIISK